jgi:hypothetical protein
MADAKIINYGQQISAGSTAIPDNNVSALDIESTEAKDFISISTAEGDESVRMVKTEHFAYGDTLTNTPKMTITPQGSQILFDTSSGSNTDFSFRPEGAEAFRINTDNAGVSTQDNDLIVITNSADAVAKSTIFTKSRSATAGNHTVLEDDDVLGAVSFQGSNGAAYVEGASITAKVNGDLASAASISSISAAGAGYSAATVATTATSGVGSGMTVALTVNGSGGITAASVVAGGKRYVTGNTVTVDGGSSTATLVVTADTSDMPTELIFSTTPDNASAPLDALTINASGYVKVMSPTNGARLYFYDGTTLRGSILAFSSGLYYDTPDASHDHIFRVTGSQTLALQIDATNAFTGILEATPSKALDVKNGASGGDILCYDIYTHDGGATSSDERMKENIVETPLGLDFVNSLEPVSYKWKDTEEVVEMRTVPATDDEPEHEEVANTYEAVEYTRTHHGLISQQVKQALTGAGLSDNEFAGYIYDSERDEYRLRYSEFIAPLIKAVQELSARVAELEAGD